MFGEGRGVDGRYYLVVFAARLPGPQELDALYRGRTLSAVLARP
jgi:hypothetical protein